MGLIRKVTSMSTLGLVDFRSDKERTAAYTKATKRESQQQTALMRQQMQMQQQQLAMQAHQAVQPQPGYQQPLGQQQVPPAAIAGQAEQQFPPGWYQAPADPNGVLRWWDGYQWTQNTNA